MQEWLTLMILQKNDINKDRTQYEYYICKFWK